MTRQQRKGNGVQTFSGVEFYPFDPRPEEILIEDIAHALSLQCRYAGHARRFYSVAEHSVRVAELCPREWQLWALLHDASEAYLVDLPRPVKQYGDIGRLYREAENLLMAAICDRFGLTWQDPMPEPVEQADNGMLWVESRELMPPNPRWERWRSFTTGRERPIGTTLTPDVAEGAFLAFFHDVYPGGGAA